jgi:hypothetical protein
MSTFEVPILAIDDVYDHPNADRLSILRIRGYEAITNKLEDGSHRFSKGEPIIYVPEGAVVQERDLKDRGYWNAEQGKGMLAGSQGNRVKAIRLRNVSARVSSGRSIVSSKRLARSSYRVEMWTRFSPPI